MADHAEPPEIYWFFDLVSPFSYLALPRVEALARRYRIAFRPVVLGALLTHWGNLGPAEIASKRLHTYRLCLFMAERAGMRMRFPPRHPFNSLAAQRLITALGANPGYIRVAFDFIWSEGRDPSEAMELAELAVRLGVTNYAALVEAQSAKASLRAVTEAAAEAGVFGVPTLMIGGELFWGVDAMPLAETYLADAELFNKDEMARLTALPVGVVRRRKRHD